MSTSFTRALATALCLWLLLPAASLAEHRGPFPAQAVGADLESLASVTVLVATHPHEPRQGSWGSGVIISDDGLILTNAHVAATHAPGLFLRYPDLRFQPRSPRRHTIYMVEGLDDPATPRYQAEVVAADGWLDLAVLRIVAYADGTPVSAAELALPFVEIGESGDLRPLDQLTVLGFPGIANSFRVRALSVEIRSFEDDERVGRRAWIRADEGVAPGNSGGLAVDDGGLLVAIPTQVITDELIVGITESVLRPTDLAGPLIEAARTGATYDSCRYVVCLSPESGSATPVGLGTDAEAPCGPGAGPTPAGAEIMYASIEFLGMADGDHVVMDTLHRRPDGVKTYLGASTFDWDSHEWGSGSCITVSIYPTQGSFVFPEGEYELLVSVGPAYERQLGAGSFSVGGQASPSSRPGEASGEARLETSIPAAYRELGLCEPFVLEDGEVYGSAAGAVASLICFPDEPVDNVVYTLFDDAAVMSAFYEGFRSDEVATGVGDCPRGEGEAAYDQDGEAVGRVACWQADGATFITWTHEPLLIHASGVSEGVIDWDALGTWWRDEAGPGERQEQTGPDPRGSTPPGEGDGSAADGDEPGPPPEDGETTACDAVPVREWAEHQTKDEFGQSERTYVMLESPDIPYGPWIDQRERLMHVSDRLAGPMDRAAAEEVARRARAERSDPFQLDDARWLVVEADGAYHTLLAWLFDPLVITGYTQSSSGALIPRYEPNVVLESSCTVPVSSDGYRLVTMYAKAWDGTSSLLADWSIETGTQIRDAASGEVITSGGRRPEGSPPPDVPFEAGPDADRWLLSNVRSRGIEKACRSAAAGEGWGAGAIAVVACDPEADADVTIVFALYESREALDRYFEQEIRLSRLPDGRFLRDANHCANDWYFEADPLALKGSALCWEHPVGQWTMNWTEAAWRVAAWIRASDTTLEGLQAIWAPVVRSP